VPCPLDISTRAGRSAEAAMPSVRNLTSRPNELRHPFCLSNGRRLGPKDPDHDRSLSWTPRLMRSELVQGALTPHLLNLHLPRSTARSE
jgi:hypothetical protein